MKNKKTIAVIAAACGGAVLVTAAAANYSTSNGYEVLKGAILGMQGMKNYTIEYGAALSVDGTNLAGTSAHLEMDEDNEASYLETTYNDGGDGVTGGYTDWQADGVSVTYQQGNYYAYRSTGDVYNVMTGFFGSEEGASAKILRFAELAADTVIGDLKNNFTYIGGDDDTSTYTCSIDSIQIPELVNAGISALMSSIAAQNKDVDTELVPEETRVLTQGFGEDAYTENAGCTFTVNSDNTMRDATFSAVIAGTGEDGTKHTANVTLTLSLSDVRTTVPQRVDEAVMSKLTVIDLSKEID
jgi:hypothetical protein